MFIEASVLVQVCCMFVAHSCLFELHEASKDLLLSHFMIGSGIVNKITTTTVEHCGVNELLGS